MSNHYVFMFVMQHELNYKAIEEAINNNVITCFVKKIFYTYASTSTEIDSVIILHKTPLAEIVLETLSTITTSQSNTQLPTTDVETNEIALTIGAKATNVDSSLFSRPKITNIPTKKQRIEKSEKED